MRRPRLFRARPYLLSLSRRHLSLEGNSVTKRLSKVYPAVSLHQSKVLISVTWGGALGVTSTWRHLKKVVSHTGVNGHLFVCSLVWGAVMKILLLHSFSLQRHRGAESLI